MLSDKKLEKLQKILGLETIHELDAAPIEDLQVSIVTAEHAVKTAADELEANEQYQQLKESLKALSEGLRDVTKRQKAITQYCLHLLEEKGQK